jgi:zinc transport system ATP-binding protein
MHCTGRLAVVPQRFEHPLVLPVSVGDFLAASRTEWPVALGLSAATREKVKLALAAADAEALEPKLLSELSGGELRRVLLANALEPEPELLLLDEPDTGLDAAGQAWLDATLKALKPRVTTLLVSHDAERVARLADAVTRVG